MVLFIQEAWIQHATVRDNILFGKPFIPDKYFAIIKACALEPVSVCSIRVFCSTDPM